MTPIRCFRIDIETLRIYTEDWAGHKEFICQSGTLAHLDWLLGSLMGFHTKTIALNFHNDEEYIRTT